MFAIFFILWVIFNERITLEIAVIGFIVCAGVDLFTYKIIGKRPKRRLPARLRLLLGSAKYLVRLLVEVFRCNWSVIRLIVSPKYEVEPELHYFHTRLKSDDARVVLANSITLTPGTITCTMENDELCVHTLDHSMAEGIENSDFEKQLLELEAIADE